MPTPDPARSNNTTPGLYGTGGNGTDSTNNSPSPYHVLAQLTSAISQTASQLISTHQEFTIDQVQVFKTGVSLKSTLRDVRTGLEVEALGIADEGTNISAPVTRVKASSDKNYVPMAPAPAPTAPSNGDAVKSLKNTPAESASSSGKKHAPSKKQHISSAPINASSSQTTNPWTSSKKKGTSNIHKANNDRGITEIDPIVID